MYVEVLRFRGKDPVDTVTIKLHEGMFHNRQLNIKTIAFILLIINKKIIFSKEYRAGYRVGEVVKFSGIIPVDTVTIKLHGGMIHHPLAIIKTSEFFELIINKKIKFSKTEARRAGKAGQNIAQLVRHRGTAIFLLELIQNAS